MQGINYVRNQKGNEDALKSFRYFLDNIPAWDNTILQTKSITEFINLLAEQFERMTGIAKSELVPELAHMSTYDRKARQ